MVDAVSVKIFRHLAHTMLPPFVVVLSHLFPIVSWEAPVLPFGGEWIGRGSGLAVQVEVMRFGPRFHAVRADADWNVAFQQDAFLASIVAGSQ